MRAVFALLLLASATQAQFDMCQFIPQCTINQCPEPFTIRGGSQAACESFDGVVESWRNMLTDMFPQCGPDWEMYWCNLIEAFYNDFEESGCTSDTAKTLAPCKESCEDIMWDCSDDAFWVENMCSGFRSEGSGLCYPMAMDNDPEEPDDDDEGPDGDEEFPDGPDFPDLPDFPDDFPLAGDSNGMGVAAAAAAAAVPAKACDADLMCPLIWAPVCGSNGVTFGNECEFGKAKCADPTLTVSFVGDCEEEQQQEAGKDCADVMCPMIWAPVCGSDSITYSNECEFGRAKCMDPALSLAFTGDCEEEQVDPVADCDAIMCAMIYEPVCGSDLHTYGNACEFSRAVCKDPTLAMSFTGACEEAQAAPDCDAIMCPMIWDPVCGSDVHTYSNECEFSRAACKDPTLSMSFTGECEENELPQQEEPAIDCGAIMCPKNYDPVCASNGVTYGNECQLSVAKCADPSIALAFVGDCQGELGGIANDAEPAAQRKCTECLDMFEAGHAACDAIEATCFTSGGDACQDALRCVRDIDAAVRLCSAECIAN